MSRNFFEEFAKNDFFEKKASENENIKNTLGSITPSVLEKLAEEIGAISDEEDMTLEQKLASEEEEKEEVKEESKEEKEKEEPKEDKEAAGCSEDEVKQAYEIAEQKLASAGLTVADYVYEKTASESTALFVSANAEKLASLSDKSTLQVADEILSAMAEKLG